MAKKTKPPVPRKAKDEDVDNGTGRGPGTLDERIAKLKEKLTTEDIKRAEKLAKDETYDVLRLAHYLNSLRFFEDKKAERIRKHQEVLRRLQESDQL